MKEYWAAYDFGLLRRGVEVKYEFEANWKLAVENFSENYHLPGVHPELNRTSRMEDHYNFDVGRDHLG